MSGKLVEITNPALVPRELQRSLSAGSGPVQSRAGSRLRLGLISLTRRAYLPAKLGRVGNMASADGGLC